MATTPNMNLDKPTPSVDTGPGWATRLNADLDLLDAHDHSTGKGAKVTPAGLAISSDLVASNAARLRQFGALGLIAGAVTENLQVRTDGADLQWRDASGNLVTLTNNGRPNTKFVGSVTGLYMAPTGTITITGTTTLTAAGGEILIIYDMTAGAYALNLPSLSTVFGRMYWLHEKTGSTNALTVTRNGADKINNAAANLTLNTANRGTLLIADPSGVSWWVF